MKIAILTGGRWDRGVLTPVHAALAAAGHSVEWVDVEPAVSHAAATARSAVDRLIVAQIRHSFEMIVMVGDRSEVLGAAVAANALGVRIAHLSGGDVTEGSQDDCFRHAISKLAHLHFPTHQEAGDRLIRMGEQPDRVHVVGCPGIDRIMTARILTKAETLIAVGLAEPAG